MGMGCSSFFAAMGRPDDLSVVRRGATREEVEDELGSPKSERETPQGVEATYRVRVGPGGSPLGNAAEVAGVFAQAGPIVATDGEVGLFLRLILAVPVAVGTDLVLSAREVSRIAKNKRDLIVRYDESGRVASFSGPDRK
jgi:hypothetical protein